MSDEASCNQTGFKCRSANQYVDYSRVCDQHRDCLDGSDENAGCKPALTCAVGGTMTAIRADAVCNRAVDCDDGSDEPIECARFACPTN